MAHRIIEIPADMTWENFREKYWKFFPISDEAKKIKRLASEYERLTGIKPDLDGKAKAVKRSPRKADPKGDGAKSNLFGESSRGRSNEYEHGSAIQRPDGERGDNATV